MPVMRSVSTAATALAAAAVVAGCGGDTQKAKTTTVTRTVAAAPTAAPQNVQIAMPLDRGAAGRPVPRGGSDAILGQLPTVPAAPKGAVAPKIRGSDRYTLTQFLTVLSDDVGAFWQELFNKAKYKFAPIRVYVVTGKGTTKCGPGEYDTNFGTAFYCRLDPAIHLPVGWFKKVINPIGDTANAVVVSHEWGHRVQDMLGIFTSGDYTGRQLEMQADCLAGVWMRSVVARDLLEAGDVREAINVEAAGGDAPDTPVENQHGVPQERVDAFGDGFTTGDVGNCKASKFKAATS